MTEAEERKRFVDSALAYIGTTYHHAGMVKGAGVDCATLLICAATDAGLIDGMDLGYYSPQWNLHRSEEKYLDTISTVCREVSFPALPGDICVWRFGRTFSHAAIVVEWPRIVHAVQRRGVSLDDGEKLQTLRQASELDGIARPRKLFSFWAR